MKTITTFEQFKAEAKDGMNIECNIDGTPIKGKITIEDGDIYICQDEKDGDDCKDKKLYKYSWIVVDFNFDDLSNIKLQTEEKTFPREMYVSNISEEDALERKEKRIVIGNFNLYLAVSSGEEKAFNNGGRYAAIAWIYAVEIPEEKTELTLQEIADKFGIDVNNLKIKK